MFSPTPDPIQKMDLPMPDPKNRSSASKFGKPKYWLVLAEVVLLGPLHGQCAQNYAQRRMFRRYVLNIFVNMKVYFI